MGHVPVIEGEKQRRLSLLGLVHSFEQLESAAEYVWVYVIALTKGGGTLTLEQNRNERM